MESKFLPDNITPESVRELVLDYPKHIPDGLRDLEEIRMVSIPNSLEKLKKAGNAFLILSELAELTEWKL